MQYPGRQDRRGEEAPASIPLLADAIATHVSSYGEKPMVFFGHSMGATVAYEVTRRLATNHQLIALIVSGRSAPSQQRRERVHTLPDDQLISELRSLGGTDSNALANDEIIRMVLPVVRSDYRAIEKYSYVPGPEISIPIYVNNGSSDSRVSLKEAGLWQAHTSSTCETRIYPGGHFYINQNLESLAEHIKNVIEINSAPS